MNFRLTTFVAAAAALAVSAGAAQAAVTYDANLAPPGVYAGDGIPNGHFTINTVDGVELGLRARPYPLPVIAPTSTNLYTIALGDVISFDWSFNPGADGSPAALAGLDSLMTITNVGTGGTFSFNPFLVGDNDTDAGAPGGHQNSWRLSFGFLNGDILPGLDIDYDENVNSTYNIDWTVTADAFGSISNSIVVNQGAGAAIPEPGTWALMILGFGAAGAMLRRRVAVTA